MIYINPVGGLGNMLFHIASIWTLAKDNGDDLCLLNIDEKINVLARYYQHNAPKYIFNRLHQINGNAPYQIKYPFQHIPLEYKNEHEYIGFFQCEEYFKHKRNEILELFRPADEFIERIEEYSHLFNNISLHVRRGENVGSPIHIPPSTEYYLNAISILPKDMSIIIFSDDLEWCRENFIDDRYVFIDDEDYIVIHLMSMMKHHIIANSTFSWWGAWMSEHHDKKVIAPEKWFGGKLLNQDIEMNIIPSDWIRL